MEEDRGMTQWKLWGGLVVLFLAGTLMGIVGTILYGHAQGEHRWEQGPAGKQARIMARLTRELSLTPEQQAAVEPIVRRTHVDILRLRFSHQAEVDRIVADAMAGLRPTLSTAQQAKLDGLYARLQRRWQVSRDYLKAAEQPETPPEKP